MIQVGAFVSTAGGIARSVDRAQALGVDSLMIFTTSPRSFTRRIISDEDVAAFRAAYTAAGLQSLWIHGSYLMNFATDKPETLARCEDLLAAELLDADRLGASGVIIHIGSHGGRGFAAVADQLVRTFTKVLATASGASYLVFENAAGQGGAVGDKLAELGELVRQIDNDRAKVCVDTQHAYAAGYKVHTQAGLDAMLAEFDVAIGLERLVALHVNDSKVPFGSRRDRHENIGAGEIGESGLRVIAQHPKLQGLPFILEVPGEAGTGPDKVNVERLRALSLS